MAHGGPESPVSSVLRVRAGRTLLAPSRVGGCLRLIQPNGCRSPRTTTQRSSRDQLICSDRSNPTFRHRGAGREPDERSVRLIAPLKDRIQGSQRQQTCYRACWTSFGTSSRSLKTSIATVRPSWTVKANSANGCSPSKATTPAAPLIFGTHEVASHGQRQSKPCRP